MESCHCTAERAVKCGGCHIGKAFCAYGGDGSRQLGSALCAVSYHYYLVQVERVDTGKISVAAGCSSCRGIAVGRAYCCVVVILNNRVVSRCCSRACRTECDSPQGYIVYCHTLIVLIVAYIRCLLSLSVSCTPGRNNTFVWRFSYTFVS